MVYEVLQFIGAVALCNRIHISCGVWTQTSVLGYYFELKKTIKYRYTSTTHSDAFRSPIPKDRRSVRSRGRCPHDTCPCRDDDGSWRATAGRVLRGDCAAAADAPSGSPAPPSPSTIYAQSWDCFWFVKHKEKHTMGKNGSSGGVEWWI